MLLAIILIVVFFIIWGIESDKNRKHNEEQMEKLNNLLSERGLNKSSCTKIKGLNECFNPIIYDSESHKIWCAKFLENKLIEETIENFVLDNYSSTCGLITNFVAVDSFHKNILIVIISENAIKHRLISFNSIISIELKENNNLIYKKSTTNTIGRAIVGGVIAGGVGAIVGGGSAKTQQKEDWESSELKILLKDISSPSYSIVWNKKFGLICKDKANEVKDLISVIIDSNKDSQENEEKSNCTIKHEPKESFSIAEELIKLSKLKETGMISEEEFVLLKDNLIKGDIKTEISPKKQEITNNISNNNLQVQNECELNLDSNV